MKRDVAIEVAAFCVALALAATTVFASRTAPPNERSADASRVVQLRDATGYLVAAKPYTRIASASLLADRVLLELVGPDRILGYSTYGFEQAAMPQLYGDKTRVDPNGPLEELIGLAPDLLVVSDFVDRGRLARLRAAGIAVFDLGPPQGLASALEDIRALGGLVGSHDAGVALADRLRTRMARVAIDVPANARPRAIYVGTHGTQLYGGTTGSSYHDVLVAAGLSDVAATRFRGWPELTSEDVLSLAPEVVVIPTGEARRFCTHVGFDRLPACAEGGRIVEVDQRMLVDPGLGMLEAAELVRERVHGPTASGVP